MATWHLEPTRQNVHGHFSRDLPPILTIDPGDTVHYRTLDARWGIEKQTSVDVPPAKLSPRDPAVDSGHCLVGPIAITGAEPGMTLEIQIDDIRVGSWGWTVAGGWKHPVNNWLNLNEGQTTFHLWANDADKLEATNQFGHQVRLRPFMGVMGMPPDEPGILSTAPPRATGGNLDCKELIAGTSLFLPIAVAGGLFSVGDGHAVQGDGEVSVTAIECPMELVSLTFRLHKDLNLRLPRAKTKDAWLTLGVDENLQTATLLALEEMLTLMNELYGLDRLNALAFASLLVDMRITQIANGVQGVHAVLPFDALKMPSL